MRRRPWARDGSNAGRQVHASLGGTRQRPAGGLDPRARPTILTARCRYREYDGGLYVIPGALEPVNSPRRLAVDQETTRPTTRPGRGAVVPWSDIHGSRRSPPELALASKRRFGCTPDLPAGTPYGLDRHKQLLQTRELLRAWCAPEADTFDGLDAFNTSENNARAAIGSRTGSRRRQATTRRRHLGGLRVLAIESPTHTAVVWSELRASNSSSHANERLPHSGRNPASQVQTATGQPLLDPGGQSRHQLPRHAFPPTHRSPSRRLTAKVRVLNMAQTWHQVRPGEVRTNCGGCHAHEPSSRSTSPPPPPPTPVSRSGTCRRSRR